MSVYMIGYDLNRPGQNYTDLIAKIKTVCPNWWHCLDSTWLVNTNFSAVQIRDALLPFIDKSDELLVTKIYGDSAWYGFDQNCSDWLKSNLS